jgi:hypothetical protein
MLPVAAMIVRSETADQFPLASFGRYFFFVLQMYVLSGMTSEL